ncbi:phosphatase PAP2 family protein [Kitasatospora sp. NPDC052868]|uniref:phosphatase PAP2 family protein n=1 Tax=Kitasatospora sp. NPDC052868 TaxID=3364060 RepID=UPI0037CA8FAB
MPRPPGRSAAAAGIPLLLFGLLTALLAVHGWGPYPVESALHSWAVAHRPAWAVHIADAVTDLGTGLPPYLAAVAAGVLLARRAARPEGRAAWVAWIARALAPLAVLALGQLVRHGLMSAFGRPRPPMADWVAASPSGYAYPSGHSFTAAVAAGVLAWAILRGARRPWTVPVAGVLGLAAVAVGLTRVYLGVHWPFDVVGGWLLAAFWLGLTLPMAALIGRPPSVGRTGGAPVEPDSGGPRR